eukprot:m.184880 g.184880  ORF g.184880 m.184880 type:complete len:122 (+) comp16257_c0_seq1:3274-3639(+)
MQVASFTLSSACGYMSRRQLGPARHCKRLASNRLHRHRQLSRRHQANAVDCVGVGALQNTNSMISPVPCCCMGAASVVRTADGHRANNGQRSCGDCTATPSKCLSVTLSTVSYYTTIEEAP